MATQSLSITEDVLNRFRKGEVSTQTAARLLDLSHAEFTRLASEHGIPTSTCYDPQTDLVESIFGKHTA